MSVNRLAIRDVIDKVHVQSQGIRIEINTHELARKLALGHSKPERQTIELIAPVRLTRSGMAMRLIHTNGKAGAPRSPDPALVRLLLKAQTLWASLAGGDVDIATIAREEGVNDSWITRVVRLNFLAPSIVSSILDGDQLVRITPRSIVSTYSMPINWLEQIEMFAGI